MPGAEAASGSIRCTTPSLARWHIYLSPGHYPGASPSSLSIWTYVEHDTKKTNARVGISTSNPYPFPVPLIVFIQNPHSHIAMARQPHSGMDSRCATQTQGQTPSGWRQRKRYAVIRGGDLSHTISLSQLFLPHFPFNSVSISSGSTKLSP